MNSKLLNIHKFIKHDAAHLCSEAVAQTLPLEVFPLGLGRLALAAQPVTLNNTKQRAASRRALEVL